MKFEVKNRWSGEVQFTAEIEADDTTSLSVKIGLAVKWAVKSRADLSGADLSGADLSGADLSRAYLSRADLSGADLSGADLSRAYLSRADLSGAYLSRADLSGAYLSGAYLSGAYLSGAYLSGAYLSGAYLSGAYLSGAYLSRADLSGAYLSRAKGVNPHLCTPLLMLLDQPGKIRAYKLVNEQGEGIYHGGVKYEVGKPVSADDANTDTDKRCGAGVNVATLDWCMTEWFDGCRILLVEFEAKDIAAIPTATDGKFRLHRCDVVEEVDLTKIGLTSDSKAEAA